ncbi:hypothetical protein IE81DRAFT_344592 [Ceraceosorus guamensis]|uniref:Chromatin-remodeling ATPase INO80 n=1 Tax=Ceraceosorus guamensis TaxID=1522189 RepID=A0A316W6X5_9BASI|nr:hypothetical protein IE81DRAFT_344592 [Ceraceosorus guamensis]PWN45696.1 hypothetical protein IE81DRAFT_344592 [Ceraceosorus guamensis]
MAQRRHDAGPSSRYSDYHRREGRSSNLPPSWSDSSERHSYEYVDDRDRHPDPHVPSYSRQYAGARQDYPASAASRPRPTPREVEWEEHRRWEEDQMRRRSHEQSERVSARRGWSPEASRGSHRSEYPDEDSRGWARPSMDVGSLSSSVHPSYDRGSRDRRPFEESRFPSYLRQSSPPPQARRDPSPEASPSKPGMSIMSLLGNNRSGTDSNTGPSPSPPRSEPVRDVSPPRRSAADLPFDPIRGERYEARPSAYASPPRSRHQNGDLEGDLEENNSELSPEPLAKAPAGLAGLLSQTSPDRNRTSAMPASMSHLLDGGGPRPSRPIPQSPSPSDHVDNEESHALTRLSSSSLSPPRQQAPKARINGTSKAIPWADSSAMEDDSIARSLSDEMEGSSPLSEAPAPPPPQEAAPPRKKLKLRAKPLQPKKSQPRASAKIWDSDLSAEENRPQWEEEAQHYESQLAERFACIEQVYENSLTQKEEELGLHLSAMYSKRHAAIMRKVDHREKVEAKQRIARQKSRKEAQRKQRREREIEAELLGTLGEEPSNPSKAKTPSNGPAVVSKSAKAAVPTEGETGSGKGRKRKIDALAEQAVTPLASPSLGVVPLEGDDGRDDESEAIFSRASTPDEGEELATGIIPIDERREHVLAEAHRKIWTQIAKREIPKVYKLVQASSTNKSTYWRRISAVVQREAKRGSTRNTRTTKDLQLRARKVMREMLVFWKRNEKEEKELRRKADKEAMEKAKKEEELREAKRQARKLNFLITQTELYSHFVGNKLKTNEAEDSEETSGSGGNKVIDPTPADGQAAGASSAPPLDSQPAGPAAGASAADLKDIDFDDEDETNLRAHARRNAEEAVLAAKQKAEAFDARKQAEQAAANANATGEDGEGRTIDQRDLGKAFDSDDMNFLNPSSMGAMDLKQPKMLTCALKDYQLKGLNWLANLYEQGINGILADEMGLGKTVQSISLMAYLAEVHNIWGPFLVIAPASTLHNWQQEIEKFVPNLKALPYWGNVKERALLRKFWNRKQISYHRDAPFHVLVTSYQLVVSDEKYFKRVRWQYMVLDEAQAIKSSSSNRWKSLLSFDCRNRLLLTGTPVQNSMQELWALLHFIMPSLFDSHDEFSEWFSKDIETHAGGESKGSTLNEHQLRRLHMILKPFMLRRIKKNVQNELGDKIEIDVFCDMSARQRMLYRGLRERVSIAELMDKASSQDEAGMKSLMNLVMQFRKVCNHPELFERADVLSPFAFARFAQSGALSREGDVLDCPDSTQSLITYELPKLICSGGGFLSTPAEGSRAGFDTHYLGNLLNIWRTEYIHRSLDTSTSAFAALRLLGLAASDGERAFHGAAVTNAMLSSGYESDLRDGTAFSQDDDFALSARRPFGLVSKALPANSAFVPSQVVPLHSVASDYGAKSILAGPDARFVPASAVAPPVQAFGSDRRFVEKQERRKRDTLVQQMLFGLPTPALRESEDAVALARSALPGLPPKGLLDASPAHQLPGAGMQVPQMNKLIIDSSKLAHLDGLLRELKANGHRCLIYFQMTRMIDLMEEYLIFRNYKYLRLDGSSKISDRRDMVTDWQTKPEIFIFLLSTRAGGLGINLTAADTVIFYDHDWNPSNDSQAMDRAHRLGQTKQVTVYRLITKGTIDERIVKLARNKKEVQDIVVGNKAYSETGMAKPQEIVSLLLDDEELADQMLRRKQQEEAQLAQDKADHMRNLHAKRKLKTAQANAAATAAPAPAGPSWAVWDEDEDDFFGAKPPTRPPIVEVPASAPKKGRPSKNADATASPVPNGAPKKPRKSKTTDEGAGAEDGATAPSAKPSKKSRKKAGADASGDVAPQKMNGEADSDVDVEHPSEQASTMMSIDDPDAY